MHTTIEGDVYTYHRYIILRKVLWYNIYRLSKNWKVNVIHCDVQNLSKPIDFLVVDVIETF
jgi:hypothetical protein